MGVKIFFTLKAMIIQTFVIVALIIVQQEKIAVILMVVWAVQDVQIIIQIHSFVEDAL
jgi:hypothetical protein